uniref:RNA binding motif single stranded interacting protein 1 n=1 Tax=Anas platyrhynchos TaxID=8839 RepID=A0A8B9ZLK2_ANAPL
MGKSYPRRQFWIRQQTSAKVMALLTLTAQQLLRRQCLLSRLMESKHRWQSNKNRIQLTYTFPICRFQWMSRSLRTCLNRLGKVISTRILRDSSGTSRGVGFARMESTEKCEAVIAHFNGKFIKTPAGVSVPAEPLLCKFADGGQKKRQNQNKYIQNGRAWHREGEVRLAGMTLTYDPTTAALQNGFYPSPYSITANRMITQTSITPYIASPVSTYQVQSPSWMQPQPYIMQHPGAVLTPSMDHTMSLQPASMISPLTQQMSHLSLGSTGTYMPATTAMQGAYIPQYTHVQTAAVPVEEASGQQQVTVETSSDHSPYTYQQNK